MKDNLYIYGEPKPRKRFFVMDERTDGEGGIVTGYGLKIG